MPFRLVPRPPSPGQPVLQWPQRRPLTEVEVHPATLRERHGDSFGENRLFLGDNLQVLGHLLPNLHGKVRLVYLDPPFDSGGDYTRRILVKRPDGATFEEVQYRDDWVVGDYLQFMLDRLALVRELLTSDGTLYLHCDARRSHSLRCLLDEVFGPETFLGEIAWRLGNGAKGRRSFSIQHNTILVYGRTRDACFHADDPLLREPFAEGSLGTHFHHVDADGRRYRVRRVNGKDYVYYADQGKRVGSVWNDIPSMAANSPILEETTGYPTQKPEKLLARVLAASSDPGDLVFDGFLGSGTTAVVAARMGRRFVGVDANPDAIHTATVRLRGVPAGFDVLTVGEAPRVREGLGVSIVDGWLRIATFAPSRLLARLGPEDADDPLALIGSVFLEFDGDGGVFRPTVMDAPRGRERVAGVYDVPEGVRRVRVRVTDLLGDVVEGRVERG